MSDNNINQNKNDEIRVIFQDTARKQYEVLLPRNDKLNEVSAEFFDEIYGEPIDEFGTSQRAVAELVDPNNPDNTKRLNGDETLDKLGIWDGAIIRIFPESIAGQGDERRRISALVADHKDIIELKNNNPEIDFIANLSHAPYQYKIIFTKKGIIGLEKDGNTPIYSDHHELEIKLGKNYPGEVPEVKWITPIFHPNISPVEKEVCLGVLGKRYLPGLGLARLVNMLFEMLQYRNYDNDSPYNKDAANWAQKKENQKYITEIGGYKYQDPVETFLKKLEKLSNGNSNKKYIFKPVERQQS